MIRSLSYKKSIFIAASILAIILAALWRQSSILMEVETGEMLEEVLPAIESEFLLDIGVVDFNGDSHIDVFTTNHNHKQLLLENDGTGSFIDVLSEAGLSQSNKFPGIELANRVPDSNEPGFYIYWRNLELILKWSPLPGDNVLNGKIVLGSPIRISKNTGFDINVTESRQASGSTSTVIEFVAGPNGEVRIAPKYIAIPVFINVTDEFPLSNVYVGQDKVSPYDHEFEFSLADRHGMAWADYDHDKMLDVYITRGGLKGHMDMFSEVFTDELYRNSKSGFENVIDKSKIVKNNCPGYQVQWVDYDNDNALDLYISCQRGNKNKLFRNDGAGVFSEIATEQGVDIIKNSFDTPFLWIDIDQDGDLDLLINEDDQYKILNNTGLRFEAEQANIQLPNVSKMTVNDYDHDGDLDVFAVSGSGHSALLKNMGGKLKQIPASALGLPDKGLTVNWVDYDNDGLADLHVVPGGIYRQNSKHTFEETGILRHKSPWSIYKTRANWVDLDNDGDRDLIMAVYYKEPFWQQLYDRVTGQYVPLWDREVQHWSIRVFLNKTQNNGNHWLQLEVDGKSGNGQAIGAFVTMHTNDYQVAAQVGQSEGSHMSQGHYRLYFGLGNANAVSSIAVRWPNGQGQVYQNLSIDSLVKITQE